MSNVAQATTSPQAVFRDRLIHRRGELSHALEGSGISPDRFIRAAVTAAQTSPDLVTDVTFQSLWGALLRACNDGLLPDGRHGAIVPYKRKAVWIPMYQGIIWRFQNSGEFKWIGADFHRDDDLAWDVWVDEMGQHFMHRPGERKGKIKETYAAATTKSGGFFLTVITEPDMQHIRESARAKGDDSPWQKWNEQMRLKTAIKRLGKVLPMSQHLDDLINRDEDDSGEPTAAPPSRIGRPRSAVAALERFAEDDETQEPQEPQQDQQQEPQEQQSQEPEPPQDDDRMKVRIEVAYERGRQANADGEPRNEMPPEYRTFGRSAELNAWWRGWDAEKHVVKNDRT